jgi:hypothetical protein
MRGPAIQEALRYLETRSKKSRCSLLALSLGIVEMGRDMAFIVVGIAIGASCALLRHRVFMMLALSALLGPVVALIGFGLHAHPWVIAAQTLGTIVALQFVYVAVGLTLHLVRFGKLMPHAQTAIGDRLRAELEAPRGLTPELSVLVERLVAS